MKFSSLKVSNSSYYLSQHKKSPWQWHRLRIRFHLRWVCCDVAANISSLLTLIIHSLAHLASTMKTTETVSHNCPFYPTDCWPLNYRMGYPPLWFRITTHLYINVWCPYPYNQTGILFRTWVGKVSTFSTGREAGPPKVEQRKTDGMEASLCRSFTNKEHQPDSGRVSLISWVGRWAGVSESSVLVSTLDGFAERRLWVLGLLNA